MFEVFAGREITAYSNFRRRYGLFYWHREARSSNAEVDFVMKFEEGFLPVEIKSGKGGTLNSLNMFLDKYREIPRVVRSYGEKEKRRTYRFISPLRYFSTFP